jgi:hypothetical protein
MDAEVLTRIQRVVSDAVDERRGLVIHSRLTPVEVDRVARRVERSALEKIGDLLKDQTTEGRVARVRNRLDRMRDELQELGEQGQIRETSRQMQTDEIVWQAFEDIAGMLGVR